MARIIEWLDSEMRRVAINLDHVVCIKEAGKHLAFYGVDQLRIESCEATNFPDGLDALAAPVVPAAPDASGLLINDLSIGDEPINRESLHIEPMPIVAWRIIGNDTAGFGPEPIFLDPPMNGTFALVCLPGGRLLRRGERVYENLDQALDAIIHELKQTQARQSSAPKKARAPAK